jgi:hypothetical protein
MSSELGEIIKWALAHEDRNIYYLGRLMDWWRLEGPAKLPDGLHVEVLTHLQLLYYGAGPPGLRGRHPHPLPHPRHHQEPE